MTSLLLLILMSVAQAGTDKPDTERSPLVYVWPCGMQPGDQWAYRTLEVAPAKWSVHPVQAEGLYVIDVVEAIEDGAVLRVTERLVDVSTEDAVAQRGPEMRQVRARVGVDQTVEVEWVRGRIVGLHDLEKRRSEVQGRWTPVFADHGLTPPQITALGRFLWADDALQRAGTASIRRFMAESCGVLDPREPTVTVDETLHHAVGVTLRAEVTRTLKEEGGGSIVIERTTTPDAASARALDHAYLKAVADALDVPEVGQLPFPVEITRGTVTYTQSTADGLPLQIQETSIEDTRGVKRKTIWTATRIE